MMKDARRPGGWQSISRYLGAHVGVCQLLDTGRKIAVVAKVGKCQAVGLIDLRNRQIGSSRKGLGRQNVQQVVARILVDVFR